MNKRRVNRHIHRYTSRLLNRYRQVEASMPPTGNNARVRRVLQAQLVRQIRSKIPAHLMHKKGRIFTADASRTWSATRCSFQSTRGAVGSRKARKFVCELSANWTKEAFGASFWDNSSFSAKISSRTCVTRALAGDVRVCARFTRYRDNVATRAEVAFRTKDCRRCVSTGAPAYIE